MDVKIIMSMKKKKWVYRIMNDSPIEGFLRLNQIVGNKTTPAIIPISKSSWWAGVKEGRFPQPVKLGKRTTVWKTSDIRLLIEKTT
jgi:predicted DNA-binding transcriptional regulator AlpA